MGFEEVMARSEQMMQEILEQNRSELDAFLEDETCEHLKAKAYIAFALAHHFALKGLSDGRHD